MVKTSTTESTTRKKLNNKFNSNKKNPFDKKNIFFSVTMNNF